MNNISKNRNALKSAAAGLCALTAWSALPAMAGEVYVPIGIPGIGIGYAHALNDNVGVRADFMTLGRRNRSEVDSGIRYDGTVKASRGALLVDAFPFAGSFRVTAGVAANDFKLALDANGAGGSLTIGNRTYTTTAGDGINVQVKFPGTTPYVGIGWGHQAGSGWRFSADLGAAIGKAKVTARARGNLANQPDIQSNLDKELAELREGVGKVQAIPQVSFGIGYSF